MVESITQNYGWTKPEVTKSASTWGGFLNTDLDSIDAIVFSNQQGIVPIGSIQMFGAAAAPANWLLCDGSVYSISPPYDKLFAVLQYGFGGTVGLNFAVPNLVQKFALGAGPNPVGQAGGAFSVPVAVGNLPPHNHPASQDPHVHAAWQNAHTHVIATGGHSHGIVTGGHSHAIHTGAHSHTIPDNLVIGSGSGLTPGGASFSLHGGASTGTSGDLGGNTDAAGNLGGNTDTAGNLGGNTDTQAPAVAVDTRQPNVYTGNTGSGTPLSVVPPFVAVSFIIRYT